MGWRSVVHAFQQLPLEEQRLALEELSSTLHVDVALEAWYLGRRSEILGHLGMKCGSIFTSFLRFAELDLFILGLGTWGYLESWAKWY